MATITHSPPITCSLLPPTLATYSFQKMNNNKSNMLKLHNFYNPFPNSSNINKQVLNVRRKKLPNRHATI
jgi:hypothetical protein